MLEHECINVLVDVCVKVLFNVSVNSYGHVETIIDSITLFTGQA